MSHVTIDPTDPLDAQSLTNRPPPATCQRLLRDVGLTLAEIAERCGQSEAEVWEVLQADGLPVTPDSLTERADAKLADLAATGDVSASKLYLPSRLTRFRDAPVTSTVVNVINAAGDLTPEQWMARVRARREAAEAAIVSEPVGVPRVGVERPTATASGGVAADHAAVAGREGGLPVVEPPRGSPAPGGSAPEPLAVLPPPPP